MNEMLLQFIWQYSLYSPAGLLTTGGEEVTVIHPGKRNHHAGPDFEEARIRLGKTTLVGNVELHVHTSDWYRHGHTTDKAYQNIILHVVYRDDMEETDKPFAKLQLHPHIPAYVIDQYTHLIQTTQPVACARQLPVVKPLVKESWLSRLLAERWEQKLGEWKELLDESAGDWRNLLYWRMAANFGFKVNADPFLQLARSLPVNLLARYKESLFRIEALLYGQAGMLEQDFNDSYPRELKQEYLYLRAKHQLQPMPMHLWRFMRMRPPNFPTIRIAQFAALIHKSVHLFSRIIETASIKELYALLQVAASEYWSTHFRFDEEQQQRSFPKVLGKDSIDNIIINTVAPVQFLYAHYHGRPDDQERSLQLLTSVPAEHNKVMAVWEGYDWRPEQAAMSQSLLQLFNNYCAEKRCLECAIGLSIIKSRPVE